MKYCLMQEQAHTFLTSWLHLQRIGDFFHFHWWCSQYHLLLLLAWFLGQQMRKHTQYFNYNHLPNWVHQLWLQWKQYSPQEYSLLHPQYPLLEVWRMPLKVYSLKRISKILKWTLEPFYSYLSLFHHDLRVSIVLVIH